MFILGAIALIFNCLECIINFSNNLYKQSLYNCIRLYSNIGAATLAIRNIVVSFANLCIIDNDWFFESEKVCLGRAIIDIFVVGLFQVAYAFEIIVFGVSIIYPIFFMKHIDNKIVKIFIGISILLYPLFYSCMMLVGRNDLPPYLGFCIIYNNWTITFQNVHCSSTLITLILVVIIYVKTAHHIRNMSSEERFKKNLCAFMCWTMLFFMVFGISPNILLVISFFMNFDCNFRNICLDTFYLTVCISIILPFPFALWKNKLIRRHFLELPCISKVFYKNPTTKISNIVS